MSKKIIFDKELGEIIVNKNKNACRYLLKVKGNQVFGTIPRYGSEKVFLSFLENSRGALIKILEKNKLKKNVLPEKYQNLDAKELQFQLLKEAKQILPQKLEYFAKKYGFSYSKLRFSSARTRWGSCSSKGVISLNIKLIILPEHLCDYVILHELCHTKEMNHGVKFWQVLDSVSDNKARQLSRELRANYRLA
jgi:predicted metal-dependent hydrolase